MDLSWLPYSLRRRALHVPRLHWPAHGLIVRLGPRSVWDAPGADNSRHAWIEYDGASILAQGRARLSEMPQAPATILLLSAEDVLLTRATVPPLAGKRLRDALAYLVEDKTLADPSSLHVALGRKQGSERVLAVVDRACMRSVLARFGAAGCRIAAVLPEALCVPLVPPAWTLVREFDESEQGLGSDPHTGRHMLSWVRTAADEALVLPQDVDAARTNLHLLLAQVAHDKRPIHIHAYGVTEPFEDDAMRLQPLAGSALHAWLVQGGPSEPGSAPPNMLQHEFAAWARRGNRFVNGYRASLLVMLLAAVQIAGLQLHWLQLRSERDQLQRESVSVLQSAFPQTTVVLEPHLQMARGLAALRRASGQSDPGDFVRMGAALGQIFVAAPPASVQTMSYADGALRLQFAPGAMADDASRLLATENARQAGYSLQFEPAGTANAGLVANLRVRTSS